MFISLWRRFIECNVPRSFPTVTTLFAKYYLTIRNSYQKLVKGENENMYSLTVNSVKSVTD